MAFFPNAANGSTGSTAPTVATEIAGVDQNGKLRYINTDVYGNVQMQIGGTQSGPFGRAHVSQPTTLFSVKNQYDLNPIIMDKFLTGTGTVTKTANVSTATLSTGGTLASAGAIYQSDGYYRYEPGKGQNVFMTGVIGAYTQYVRKMFGYGDNLDGVFFDMDGTTAGANAAGATGLMAVTLRSSTSGSAVDTQVLQSSWNVDKFDGTGPSGIIIDFTKPQIFVIDLQWLGDGVVRLGFDINRVLYAAHEFRWANVAVSTAPYMNTANLPVRWSIANDSAHATAGATTIVAGCASIISNGGSESPNKTILSVDNNVSAKTVASATAFVPLVSLSPSLTLGGSANRVIYKLVGGTVMCTGAAGGKWGLFYNASLGGTPAFSNNDSFSGMSFDTAATAIGGLVITAISTAAGVTTITWAGNSVNGASQGLNNVWAGYQITVSGFGGGNTGNNGTFTIASSTGTTITYPNASGTSAGQGGGTTFVVPGLQVASGFFSQATGGGNVQVSIPLPDLTKLVFPFTLSINGTSADVFTLAAISIGGTSTTVLGQLSWNEDR